MQEPLLSVAPPSLQRLRLRGGADEGPLAFCGCFTSFAAFMFLFCMSSVGPNTYGLMRNSVTGTVGHEAYRGTLVWTGPLYSFLTFPATAVTIEFSPTYGSDGPPVRTRTGADPNDPDSGGQPLQISAAFQYYFVKDKLNEVYTSFGGQPQAHQRFVLLSGNMISNTAQKFTPQDFWTKRNVIAERMLHEINQTLWNDGHVVVTLFEIMRVDFAQQFEDSITAVQVAEQQKVVNEYSQQVAQVAQSIEVMKSKVNAHIANISAGAEADAKEMRAKAGRDAFHMKQAMKATKYKELQKRLDLNAEQMTKYFKIKAIQQQGSGTAAKMVVGMPSPIGAGVSDHKAARAGEL